MKKIILAIFLFSSLAMTAQVKQRSTTKGFSAAIQGHTLGWTSTYFQYLDENSPSGYGGGLRLGYGVTDMIEPYLAIDFTTMGTSNIDAQSFKMRHLDIGVRLNFVGNVHPVRPFVEAGFTSLKGTLKQVVSGSGYVDAEFYGGKPHLGGGVSWFPSVPINIFVKGIFTVGKKSNLDIDGVKSPDKPDVTTFRISVGVGFNISELVANK